MASLAERVAREAVRPHIDEHGGRIIRIKGDGILVEFASAVEAVQSASAVQQALSQKNAAIADEQRIRLRIGINVGDVLTIDNADIHGDGVNVAARLEPLADPGGICISAAVYEHIRAKLACPFEDRGTRSVKNIESPVRIFVLGPDAIEKLPCVACARSRTSLRRWQAAAAILVLAAVAALWTGWVHLARPADHMTAQRINSAGLPVVGPVRQQGAPPLSIVVLPFANNGEAAYEEFTDGMTDDLTTDLSRIPGSVVISPSTAYAYKGKSIDVRQLGRELSVRYALQGTVRRNLDAVRINAQLVETIGATQIWAGQFRTQVAEFSHAKDDLTQRIAQAMNVALIDAESERVQRERPEHPDAVDVTLRGMSLLNRPPSKENVERAHELFERALKLKPDYLPALKGLGQVMIAEWGSTWYTGSSKEHLAALEQLVNKAVSIAPDDAMVSYVRGYVEKRLHNSPEQALVAFERAIALDPNLAAAHNYIGQMKVFLGRANEVRPSG